MSVMATFLPEIHAMIVPSATASAIKARLCRPGKRNVAAVASSMPAPAQRIPLAAVFGEAMRLMPRMNSRAAAK